MISNWFERRKRVFQFLLFSVVQFNWINLNWLMFWFKVNKFNFLWLNLYFYHTIFQCASFLLSKISWSSYALQLLKCENQKMWLVHLKCSKILIMQQRLFIKCHIEFEYLLDIRKPKSKSQIFKSFVVDCLNVTGFYWTTSVAMKQIWLMKKPIDSQCNQYYFHLQTNYNPIGLISLYAHCTRTA